MVDRWLENDWVLRILSLLLAIGIWASQTLAQNPTVVRHFNTLPVTVQDAGHLHAQASPDTVRVEIQGPANIVNGLQPSAILVTASVPYAKAGTYRVKLNVAAPVAGTEVVSVVPGSATVRLASP